VTGSGPAGPVKKPGMCERHRAEWMKWLDWIGTPSCQAYSQGGINLVAIGQDNPKRIEEGRQARANRVYDLVREQQASIRAECMSTCHQGAKDQEELIKVPTGVED